MGAALQLKRDLVTQAVAQLGLALSKMEDSARLTREGATHEEAKPENDKDTRALEATYLARGQAKRVEELRTGASLLRAMELRAFRTGESAALSALVTVREGDTTHRYFLTTAGGGLELSADGQTVRVVTVTSPVGRALVGKETGEVVQVAAGAGLRELELVEIR